MRIDDYKFGRIVIGKKVYTKDVIVFPDHVKENWWRKSGHNLVEDDIKDVIEYRPELLVIGRGKFGLMKVGEELLKKLKELGVEVVVGKTDEAIRVYNSSDVERKVGAFHLTC